MCDHLVECGSQLVSRRPNGSDQAIERASASRGAVISHRTIGMVLISLREETPAWHLVESRLPLTNQQLLPVVVGEGKK